MKVTIDSLEEFASVVGFWAGAKDRWDSYSDNEKEYLEQIAYECEFTSLAQINDFIWFDADELLEEYHAEEDDEEEDDEEGDE